MRGEIAPDGSMVPILTDSPGFFSDPRVIQADWPAMSGVTTARSMARLLNATLGYGDGEPLLARADLEAMIAERRHGMDRTLGHVTRFGSGVELPHGWLPYLGGTSFGHQGAGGAVVAADPGSGIVLAYTCTHTASSTGGSDAALTLLSATRHLLEED